MNLFKKQKFSIRKFTVGTFSTVIATLAFITHTGHAAELDKHEQTAQHVPTDSNTTGDLAHVASTANNSQTSAEVNKSVDQKNESQTSNTQSGTDVTTANNQPSTQSVASTKEANNEASTSNNVDNNQPTLSKASDSKDKASENHHKRVKRDVTDRATNLNESSDPMAINETNSGQVINGNFTDTSAGAEIPTVATESAMDAASTIPGWKVVNSQQTQIPLIWGPKALPSYTYITFDKTENKIGAVLSKYSDNLSAGVADNSVGPIYQDIDVTPGSELQFHFLGTSINNISGFNSARLYVYDGNNPSKLLYKGTPKTSNQKFGIFKGVFNVPDDISKIRIQFESAENQSHDSYNGHRLLKGANNFGGGVVADVSVNTGAYLKTSATETEYQANSTSENSPNVNAKLTFSIENKGHSSSNKTQYKVTLPEDVSFVSAENATGTFDEDSRELTLDIDPIQAGTTTDVSYTLSLPTSVPIKKDFNGNLTYYTEGINMNRRNGSKDFSTQGDTNYLKYGGSNEFVLSESDQRQGTTAVPTQSVTVNMYKDALNNKVTEIESELGRASQSDYNDEAWNNLQTALTNAKVVGSETDSTPIIDRKSQEEINNLLLALEKAKAKFDIDKVAKARESFINSNTQATTEEKQTAVNKVRARYKEKSKEIDKLNNNDAIPTLKEGGISQINSINVVATKKVEAKKAIEAELTNRKVYIDSHFDATEEEKNVAMAKATEEANKAKALVDQATSNSEVDEAKTNGIATIDTVEVDVIKKANARRAIQEAAEAKKALINQNNEATKEEKDAANQKVDDEVRKSNRLIDQVTTNDGVDEAQNNSTNVINTIQPEIAKKPAAKQDINTAVSNQKALVNQNSEATQEEKDVALAKIDEEAKKAIAAIDAATTNAEVDEATSSSQNTISGIVPETVKKAAARQAIDDAANAKKEAINQTPDATEEEKQAAIAKVDAAVTASKAAINQATTNNTVDQAKDNGNTVIASIQPEVSKKAAARKAIDDEVVAKKAEIDTVNDATEEEKQAAKDKVDVEAEKAKAAINQAVTNSDVDGAQTSGVNTISAIQPDIVKKATAKQAIDDAANAKKLEIDNNSEATTEEKEAAKAKVDNEVTKAKHAIDQATTNADVDHAKDNGNNAITAIQPDIVKKATARKAIDDAAITKKALIDQENTTTQEEKEAAKAKVDAEVQKAKQAITDASSNSDVDQVQNSETNTISNIQAEAIKKAEAKQAIDDAVTAKKNEIDQHPTATTEEKEAAKVKVDEEATKAKAAIDQATTNDTVTQAKDEGTNTIHNIQPESIEKIRAKQAIDEAVTNKKALIDQDDTTTTEEKDAAKQKVDSEASKAKQAIDRSTTNDAVHTERDHGITAINNIQPEAIKKAEAKQAIDESVRSKKAEIDNNNDATQEEKDTAKSRVDEEATKAKAAIDKSTSNDDVDQAKTSGVNTITSIQPEVIKKVEAKQAIDVLVTAKKQEIDNNNDATQEEKEAAKSKVDEEATKAKAAIDQATTNNSVDQAKTSGVNIIESIQPEVIKKSEAKQAIDEQAKVKKSKLEEDSTTTKEEKDAAKAKVDEEATKAKTAIDNSTTNNEVDQAKTTGVTAITNIQAEAIKKAEAKHAIDDEVVTKKAQIDTVANATQDEKEAAKSRVDEEATKAKAAIDNAITNNDVDQAKTSGVNIIESIQPEVIKKAEAKKAIDDEVVAKKKAIDDNFNATKEEKDVAKNKADEEGAKAKQAIDQANTNDEVDQAKNNGHTKIAPIEPETIKKAEAKQAIDEVAKAKRTQIDETPNATKEEKDAAHKKVDEEVTKAKTIIDHAITNNDVDQANGNGTNTINSVTVEVIKKDQAKKAIDDLVKVKKAEIDKVNDATKEEKEAAKTKVDEEATKAKSNIDNGITNHDVDEAKTLSSKVIKSIQPDTMKKSQAKKDLDSIAKTKKSEIDKNHQATHEEKEVSKSEVDNIIKKAKKAIDHAATNNDVDKVHAKFKNEISKVQVIAKKKQAAKDRIKTIAQQQKEKINHQNGLTDEQKQKAMHLINEITRKALLKIDNDSSNRDVDSTTKKAIEDILKVAPMPSKQGQKLDNANGYYPKLGFDNGNNDFNHLTLGKANKQLPNTGGNHRSELPLIELTLISGFFLILTSRKRKEDKN
ncbi:SasC/FmtB family protein [Staphylococcus sp. GDX8P54P]|uniref:SasC/FmtB family protein n=1 Tax=Staphylococcus sp. GDX8P54P TaxID=2804099 RepID=UPI001AEC5AB8|nr:SasC/FmtB family protein [Staphylococcus sp. GDX8P54P]